MFRYTPSPVEPDLAKPEDDSDEVKDWFTTQTDPAIAQAVARAEAEARSTPSTAIAPPPIRYSVETQQPVGYEPVQPPLGGVHRAD